ncbi:DUF2306 domain-containing protein [Pseudonocardia acaciae]|uniref:DUF2306 domain-containing protein n=1 Tax=Pseudonocardia acaciae TaxID=551276 RepID=UPI0007E8DB3E|nr:DUF2306 domain-containing protein [Pseudonocardia acaciae]
MSQPTVRTEPPQRPGHRRARRRSYQQIWMPPLAMMAVIFLATAVPPYLTGDPATSRIPLHRDYPLHYPLLVAHIAFGSVALVAGCFQVWPWFRTRFRAAHRWIGRAYFFLGIFPGGIAVLGVSVVSTTGFVSSVGNTMLALGWLVTGVAGYRAARQRRFADHRAWMLRSVALTTSIVLNRPWVALFVIILDPGSDSLLGGSDVAAVQAAAGSAVWMSWVVNLLVVEWWLLRGRPASGQSRREARASR